MPILYYCNDRGDALEEGNQLRLFYYRIIRNRVWPLSNGMYKYQGSWEMSKAELLSQMNKLPTPSLLPRLLQNNIL